MAHNKGIIQLSMIVAVLLVAGFFLISGGSARESETNVKNVPSGEVQIVKMRVEGAQYILEPATVKKGVSVRLEADISQMPGCSRSVISSGLGVRKTFSSTDNTIEFIPTKAGTFAIACSMNMYKGTLTVLESDGSPSTYVEKPSAAGMACGSGGGCGCGG